MDIDRNALLVVGWGVGEYPAGEGDGCGSARPAGKKQGWRQRHRVGGVENTEKCVGEVFVGWLMAGFQIFVQTFMFFLEKKKKHLL